MLTNTSAVMAAEAGGSGLLESEVSLIVLLAVAALVAVVARAVRFPYTVALVVVGLLMAFLPQGFIEVDVSADPSRRAEMVQRAKGGRTVPQIFIGETHVGGCDELFALERAGKLDPMLAA